MNLPYLYTLPYGLVAAFFLLILYASYEFSYRIGLKKWKKGRGRDQDSRGDTVIAAMLAMLGLVLAFTYSFTVSRSDKRKATALRELNAIGTAYYRADLLDEPYREQIRQGLLDFTKSLMPEKKNIHKREEIMAALKTMNEKVNELWPPFREYTESKETFGPQEVSMMHALNEVMDSHTARVQAAFDRLPSAIHIMLLFIACASLAVAGFSSGRANALRRVRISALILVIATIMVVIIDFDRPSTGFVRTNVEGYKWMIDDMENHRGN